MNILITSAGRRVSLVRAFRIEAQKLEWNSKVFTVDLEPELSAACRISDQSYGVPEVTSANYISVLTNICVTNKIDLLIPTIDTELEVLAKNEELLKKEGVKPVVSSVQLIQICQDKRKTIRFFEERGISTPQILDKQQPEYPVYAKPYDGSSSKNNYIINNATELRDYHMENDRLTFFEYLDHEVYDEYTLDLYYDKNSDLKCVVPRKRVEVREGEVSKGLTEKNVLVSFVKEKLLKIPGARGCLTLQLFLNPKENEIYAIELNPRFGGGYPLSYLAGANYPGWLIDEYFRDKSIDFFNDWEQNLLMLRYDAEVLVHDFHPCK